MLRRKVGSLLRSKRWTLAAATTSVGLMLCAVGVSAAAASGSHASAKGPIKIEAIIDLSNTGGLYYQWDNSWIAAVKAIDAKGGINGRQINLKTCDSSNNSNAALACGQQAVSNGDVAVVSLAASEPFESLLNAHHIADLNALIDPDTYKSPNSFSLYGGGATTALSGAAMMKIAGCKKGSYVSALDYPAATLANFIANFEKGASALGIKPAPGVVVPQNVADMSPYIADAVKDGADCVDVSGPSAGEVGLIRAALQSPTPVKIVTTLSYLSPQTVASLGKSVVNKLYVADTSDEPTDTSNPTVRQWVQQINKYSPSPKALNATGAVDWEEIQLLAYAFKHVSNVTAPNVLKYLSHLKNYKPGLTPPVSFATPQHNFLGSRIFSPNARRIIYKNGKWYDDGPFVNLFTGKEVNS